MNNYAAAELRCTQMYMTNEERTMANSRAAVGRTQQDPFIYMLSEGVRHSLHPQLKYSWF